MIKTIALDLEARSSVDLTKCGVYKYAQSTNFDIILFGYSINGGEVSVVDLACGERIPEDVLKALVDDAVIKTAFNASFERTCLASWLRTHRPDLFSGDYLSPASWRCTMVWAAYNGLPLSLDKVGEVLGFEKQKLKEGKELIRYFCLPSKNSDKIWNLPEHAPDRWKLFKEYNKRDVEVELQIQERLKRFPVPAFVWDEYCLDQEINDRGIMVDKQLVEQAIRIDAITKADLIARLTEKTSLANPQSVMQLKKYLAERGITVESLGKKEAMNLIKTVPADVREVLSLRLQLAKSSVKKYQAMENCACADDRCRGLFQFYGANRTGRWAGRNLQLQNLPQNHIPDLGQARELVRQGDYEMLRMLYPSIPEVLSELIRTALVPRPGCKFIVCDFSAVEARALSYLAGEQWRMDVFNNGGDIYCQSASMMFKVPVEKHGVNGHLRQKGKVAELACIALNSPVLTDHGLVPIQDITLDMKLWDGKDWVRHDGVLCKGPRRVLTYDGLTATTDHVVWVEGINYPVTFLFAILHHKKLIRTGPGHKQENRFIPRLLPTYDILNAGPRNRYTVSGHLVHNCGYGGSVGALTAMGALDMGLKEEDLKPLVTAWRESNPHIVRYWWDVDSAAKTAIRKQIQQVVGNVLFEYHSGMLFITLPSGRKLAYIKPRLEENRFGGESITYMGIDQTKHWSRIESYGPKLVENITQAFCRDILAYAMQNLSAYRIVAHVHDEVILEVGQEVSVSDIEDIMSRTPPWATGLVLRADGGEMEYYQK